MDYNFLQWAKDINYFAVIDFFIALVTIAMIMIFFIYKRNIRMMIFLLICPVLDIVCISLNNYLGGETLTLARYILFFAIIFNMIICCVVYQNDFKNMFQRISKVKGVETHSSTEELQESTTEILSACQNLSKQNIGAIIIIDSYQDIHEDILDTGTMLNAKLTGPLLETIFNTKAPLHDGAVIVRGNKVLAAGCFLTLTQRNVNKEMGTRHRAAIGITEQTNVLSIVVSEETGIISVVKNGEIKRYMTMDKLRDEIEDAYGISAKAMAERQIKSSTKSKGGRFE